jgi:hypothetical protein
MLIDFEEVIDQEDVDHSAGICQYNRGLVTSSEESYSRNATVFSTTIHLVLRPNYESSGFEARLPFIWF